MIGPIVSDGKTFVRLTTVIHQISKVAPSQRVSHVPLDSSDV